MISGSSASCALAKTSKILRSILSDLLIQPIKAGFSSLLNSLKSFVVASVLLSKIEYETLERSVKIECSGNPLNRLQMS